MESIRLQANAKINLGLDVLRKREDGYHEVKMIMQSISLSDTLMLSRCPGTDIRLEADQGNAHPFVPMNEENLVYQAIRLLKEEFRLQEGVQAVLTKKIPVAAGMAGGSTDAAAALKGMNQLFSLGLSEEELCERGVRLGADIPYCIMGGTALSEGIGEKLTSLPAMPDCWILIAKPPVAVSTAFVYGNLKVQEITDHPDIDGMIKAIYGHDLHGIASRLGNVLETVTIPAYPVIMEIKDKMMEGGALRSLMSGSGPTVFGIFEQEGSAQQAAEVIRNAGLSEQIYVVHPL